MYFNEKKPVYRILLNEWTAKEVEKGMKNLKPNSDMQPLQDAGIGRQWADWIIGINLTSVATIKYNLNDNKILNIGRVLLPTLKIIYDRDKEIENFNATSYYKMTSQFKTAENKEFEGLYYEKNKEDKLDEKFEDKAYLDVIAKAIKGEKAEIIEKQTEKKKEYPPFLFNLSNLQGHVTSKYKGWTSDKVLKTAQSLYEKKFITYPRTGSICLEESLIERTQKVLNTLKTGLSYEAEIKFTKSKRIFDNSKVESHSAIVPTYMKPNGLSKDEMIVYSAIKNRFLMQFMPVAEFEETKITSKVHKEEAKGIFISRGKVQLVEGWRKVEKMETKDTILPMVSEKEMVDVTDVKVAKVTKKPPKLHTEKTLLRLMETCGKSFKKKQTKKDEVEPTDSENENEENTEDTSDEMMAAILSGFSIGTPATRAETIKKLKDIGYIQSKGKSLTTTVLGRNIVEIFPAKELLDLEYTGRLEKTLSDIEKGVVKKEEFLDLIKNFTKTAVEQIKNDDSALSRVKVQLEKGVESLGNCPVCGNPVVEGEKGFGCSNWKSGCKFTLWKNDKFIKMLGKEVNEPMVKVLLANGKVGFRNLRSKKGTTFAAYLRYVKNEKSGYYNWEMDFIDR
ncbi:MAG: type IA DNA topoisomerase [Sarcina sp.]